MNRERMNMPLSSFLQLFCISIAGFFLSVFAASQGQAIEADVIFGALPKSTVAAIVSVDAGRSLDGLNRMGAVGVVGGEDFRQFLKSASEIEPLFDPISLSPLPWQATVDLLADGAFAAVVFEVENQLPEIGLKLQMQGKHDAWKALMKQQLADAANQGKKVTNVNVDGYEISLVDNASAPYQRQAFCILDDWLIVCESESGVRQFIDANRYAADEKLTNDRRYLETIGNLQAVEKDSSTVWIFVEPLRTDFLRARAEGWPETDIGQTFGARHNFDAVRALGGWAMLGDEIYDVTYQFRIWIEQPAKNGMQLLDFRSLSNAKPSDWVPVKNVSSYATVGWNLQPILEHAGPLVNEVVEDVTGRSEQTFERFLQQLRADDGPGIDLQKDFMPLLGERIEYLSIFLPPASPTAEQSIVAIELNQKVDEVAAEVADLVELLVDSSNTLMIPIPGFAYPLWKLGSGQRAGNGPSFSTPGVMVAHDRLFFASNFNAIRQYVATARPQLPLARDSQFQKVENVLETIAGSNPAVRIVADPAEDFENTYELLRTGRVDQAESVYTMLLSPLLKNNKDKIPFEKLPSFNALKIALGSTGIQINLVDNGWELHGFNFRASP